MKKQPTLAQLIKSEQQEAARVRRFLDGHDISPVAPLWIARGVPSHWNAVILASLHDIRRVNLSVKKAANASGNIIYFAVMTCRRGSSTRAGASCSGDREVAIELAFRNEMPA